MLRNGTFEYRSPERMACDYLRTVATGQAVRTGDGSLRRAIELAAELVANEMILQSGEDPNGYAYEGNTLLAITSRMVEDAVRTDCELRAHLVGLRAVVWLRRKLFLGTSRKTTGDEQRQMAHAFAEAYCRHHLDQQTASLATLLTHEGPAIRAAAVRLSGSGSSPSSAATVTSSDAGRQ
jgi:hypothetical protein